MPMNQLEKTAITNATIEYWQEKTGGWFSRERLQNVLLEDTKKQSKTNKWLKKGFHFFFPKSMSDTEIIGNHLNASEQTTSEINTNNFLSPLKARINKALAEASVTSTTELPASPRPTPKTATKTMSLLRALSETMNIMDIDDEKTEKHYFEDIIFYLMQNHYIDESVTKEISVDEKKSYPQKLGDVLRQLGNKWKIESTAAYKACFQAIPSEPAAMKKIASNFIKRLEQAKNNYQKQEAEKKAQAERKAKEAEAARLKEIAEQKEITRKQQEADALDKAMANSTIQQLYDYVLKRIKDRNHSETCKEAIAIIVAIENTYANNKPPAGTYKILVTQARPNSTDKEFQTLQENETTNTKINKILPTTMKDVSNALTAAKASLANSWNIVGYAKLTSIEETVNTLTKK